MSTCQNPSHSGTSETYPARRRPQHFALLPTELVAEIFAHLEDTLDCIILAMTSRRCWDVGAKLAQERYFASCSAGDRMMMVGDYREANDLPKVIELTNEEKLELSKPLKKARKQRASATQARYVTSLYEVASARYEEVKSEDPFMELRREVTERYNRQPSRDSEQITFTFGAVLDTLTQRSIYAQSDLVLRDLSRREYILGETVAELSHENGLCRGINLGHVALVRIAWSSDAGSVGRGAWAGDRCDIVTKEMHQQEDTEGSEKWKNISEKAIANMEWVYQENDGFLDYRRGDGSKDKDLTFMR